MAYYWVLGTVVVWLAISYNHWFDIYAMRNDGLISNFTCTAYSDKVQKCFASSRRSNNVDYLSCQIDAEPGILLKSLFVKLSLIPVGVESNFKAIHINNFTIDLCAFFGGAIAPTFMNVFVPDLKKFSNLFQKCPLTGHKYLKDLPVDARNIPHGFPSGKYILEQIIYTKLKKQDELLFKLTIAVNYRAGSH